MWCVKKSTLAISQSQTCLVKLSRHCPYPPELQSIKGCVSALMETSSWAELTMVCNKRLTAKQLSKCCVALALLSMQGLCAVVIVLSIHIMAQA